MQKNIKTKPSFSLNMIIDLLIPIYFCSVFIFSFNTTENNIISRLLAFALIGILAFYALMKKRMLLDKWVGLLLGFLFFCLLSCLWAWDIAVAFSKCVSLFQVILLAYLVYNYIATEKKVEYLIICLGLAAAFFSIYTVFYFGIEEYFAGLEDGTRLGMEIANVNTIGRWCAIGTVINLWLVFYRRKYFCTLLMAVCGLVTIGSGSRTAIVALVCGIVFMLITDSEKKKRKQGFVLLVVLLAIMVILIQLPLFESVRDRFEIMFETFRGEHSGGSTDVRMQMIEAGMQQFSETPIGGIGIGNSVVLTNKLFNWHTYLHNNYVELLSSVGIIGTILYYSCIVGPIIAMLGKKSRKNKLAVFTISLLLMEMVCHYGTVIYSDKLTYMIIIIAFISASQIKREKEDNIVDNT